MAKFEIGTALADVLGSVSKSDAAETLQQIDINLLDSDERNFYALDGIDDLAANIELCGLQQPIRVRANPDMPGRYRIVSGHRRLAALWTLYEESPDKWGKVPCIVETDEISPAMEELRLIYANANTRKLSDADLAKQAERVQDLLYQLKEEGVEFPGRMRDHVAAACQVSATKLATLKVIREKLVSNLKPSFESGKLPTETAYQLARLPAGLQIMVTNAIGSPTFAQVKNIVRNVEEHKTDYTRTMTCPDGKPCGHTFQFIKHDADCSWDVCGTNHCCVKCNHGTVEYGACKFACSKAKRKREELIAKGKEKQKAAQDEYQQKVNAKLKVQAKRLAAAADAAGLSDEEELNIHYTAYKVGMIRDFAAGEFGSHRLYESSLNCSGDTPVIRGLRDKLKCSADYLLGFTDDLTPAAAQPQGWQTGEPTERGNYVIKLDMEDGGSPSLQTAFFENFGKCWKFSAHGGTIDGSYVHGWIKIPEV